MALPTPAHRKITEAVAPVSSEILDDDGEAAHSTDDDVVADPVTEEYDPMAQTMPADGTVVTAAQVAAKQAAAPVPGGVTIVEVKA